MHLRMLRIDEYSSEIIEAEEPRYGIVLLSSKVYGAFILMIYLGKRTIEFSIGEGN